LRREKRRISRGCGPDFVDVVGNEPLQEGAAIGSRDGENTAIGEQGETSIGHGGEELGPDRRLGKRRGREI
jgi:hypothetical protein